MTVDHGGHNRLAVLTAKRESEIIQLLWSDVDAANRTALLSDAKPPPARRLATTSGSLSWAMRGPSYSASQRAKRMDRTSPKTQFGRHCFESSSLPQGSQG